MILKLKSYHSAKKVQNIQFFFNKQHVQQTRNVTQPNEQDTNEFTEKIAQIS